MDSAMAELTDTNHTVSQIAYNVGFQDAHNFSTAFRDSTGRVMGTGNFLLNRTGGYDPQAPRGADAPLRLGTHLRFGGRK